MDNMPTAVVENCQTDGCPTCGQRRTLTRIYKLASIEAAEAVADAARFVNREAGSRIQLLANGNYTVTISIMR